LLRGKRSEVVVHRSDLVVPANAEITLGGYIAPGEEAAEGPFGDHRYYNEVERFPVLTIERITHRRSDYHTTPGPSAGRARDLGVGAQRRVRADPADAVFPNADFYLPSEACRTGSQS
jgi:4-hydroxy-3-polyprenylbenzoate decarboxylase